MNHNDDSCIDLGMTREQFGKNYDEQKFFLKRKALQTSQEATWNHLNAALFGWDPSDGLIRLFNNGPVSEEQYVERFFDLGRHRSRIVKDVLYRHLSEGATLVLNRLETKAPAVLELTMDIARFVGERAVANGYLAFGGTGTFGRHWDTHDVFAIQLIGRKHWRVYEPTFLLPLPHQRSRLHKDQCPSTPVFDDVIEAGDVLYIPRGWWHEALPAPNEPTFHIAVGVHRTTLNDFIAWSCIETLPQVLKMRRSFRGNLEDAQLLREALLEAIDQMVAPENLQNFQNSVREHERVPTSFRVQQQGRPSNEVTRFKLNSAFLRNPHHAQTVNGISLTSDETSRQVLENLFASPQGISVEDVPQEHRERLTELLAQLVACDVASPHLRFLI